MLPVDPALGFVIPVFVGLLPYAFVFFRAYGLLFVISFLRVGLLFIFFALLHFAQHLCFLLAIISMPKRSKLQLSD